MEKEVAQAGKKHGQRLQTTFMFEYFDGMGTVTSRVVTEYTPTSCTHLYVMTRQYLGIKSVSLSFCLFVCNLLSPLLSL